MKSRSAVIRLPNGVAEALKYTIGCGSSLLLKVAITSVATWQQLPLRFSYLIAMLAILFFSFFFHRQITFRRQTGNDSKSLLRDFAFYTLGVSAFNILDYVLVVVAAGALRRYLQGATELPLSTIQIINTVCIFSSSAVLFTLRFFVYRVIFHRTASA